MAAHVTQAETENSELLKAPGKRSKLFFYLFFWRSSRKGGGNDAAGGRRSVDLQARWGDVHGYHHVKRFRELPPVAKDVHQWFLIMKLWPLVTSPRVGPRRGQVEATGPVSPLLQKASFGSLKKLKKLQEGKSSPVA